MTTSRIAAPPEMQEAAAALLEPRPERAVRGTPPAAPLRPVPVIPSSMRAVTYESFGSPDVLQVRQVAVPRPGPGQVLVRIRSAAANPWDWHFMRGLPYIARLSGAGVRRPKHPVLGGDIAGEVVAMGDAASRFGIGDGVYGFIEFGGFAEYVVVPETAVAAMPRNLSFDEAAAVPLAATTALQGLRDVGRTTAGDRVLIIGASGGVGTFAVQLAKAFGAHVTAVASGRNAALVRALGADRVVDYTREDVTAGAERFDVVLQLAGTASGAALARILAPGGRGVMSSGDAPNQWIGPMGRVLRGVIAGKRSGRAVLLLTAKWNAEDLAVLAHLVEAGAIRPVIERTYPLASTADAVRHVESGRARGKVVISVAAD
jgi:NADPH:quinone reductase-like Zn-dependent oxidoreductase